MWVGAGASRKKNGGRVGSWHLSCSDSPSPCSPSSAAACRASADCGGAQSSHPQCCARCLWLCMCVCVMSFCRCCCCRRCVSLSASHAQRSNHPAAAVGQQKSAAWDWRSSRSAPVNINHRQTGTSHVSFGELGRCPAATSRRRSVWFNPSQLL